MTKCYARSENAINNADLLIQRHAPIFYICMNEQTVWYVKKNVQSMCTIKQLVDGVICSEMSNIFVQILFDVILWTWNLYQMSIVVCLNIQGNGRKTMFKGFHMVNSKNKLECLIEFYYLCK